MEAKDIAEYSLKNKNQFFCKSSPCLEFKGTSNPRIDGYTLGLWLGDGSFTEQLTLTTKEQIIINYISELYPVMKIYPKKNTSARQVRFSTEGKLAEELKVLGLRYKRSGDKFIPKKCLVASSEFRWNLLAGLIDTDGYCNKTNSIVYTTKSSRLAEGIKDLVFSLGGTASIKKISKGIKSRKFIGDYYNIKISFYDNTQIPLKLDFKFNRLRLSTFDRRNVYIKCVTSEPSEVYGFSITGKSKWYITDNWMVTHNSTLALQIAYYIAWIMAGGKMV
jgi:replicative DNA helicase